MTENLAVALLAGKSIEAIRQEILATLGRRLKANVQVRGKNGKPTKAALHMQMEFLVGATAALQAVFGDEDDRITDVVPITWLLDASFRGELVADFK